MSGAFQADAFQSDGFQSEAPPAGPVSEIAARLRLLGENTTEVGAAAPVEEAPPPAWGYPRILDRPRSPAPLRQIAAEIELSGRARAFGSNTTLRGPSQRRARSAATAELLMA